MIREKFDSSGNRNLVGRKEAVRSKGGGEREERERRRINMRDVVGAISGNLISGDPERKQTRLLGKKEVISS